MEHDEPEELPAGPFGALPRIFDRTHDLIADKLADRKRQHVEDTLHQLEADLVPLIGPIAQRIIDSPAASAELKALAGEAVAPDHQFGSMVVGFAIGATIAPALAAAIAPELDAIEQEAWLHNPSREIPPAVAVETVLKGVLTQGEAGGLAKRSGYNETQFDHMVKAAGQAIGTAEALLLLRRGQITEDEFQSVLRYSNMNPKFYGMAEKLKYGPPTVGEVITGALKGHLTEGQAREMIGEAGLNPDNFDWLLKTAGRPIGAVEASHLWRHGKISGDELEDIVRSSDVNNRFLPAVKLASLWLPPPRSIMAMWRAKALTEGETRDALTKAGVEEPFLSAMIDEGRNSGSSGTKEISQAATVRMYVTRLLTRAEARARITGLGYPGEDADLLLDFGDDLRHEQQVNATVSKVRSRYVAHKLTKTDADHALASADIPTAARTDLFDLWDVQRDANMTIPTVAAIVGALRRALITPLECRNRLTALGVDLDDIEIFVANGWPPTKPADARAAATAVRNGAASIPTGGGGTAGGTKNLTVYQVLDLYQARQLSRADALAALIALNYSTANANALLNANPPAPAPTP